MKTTERIYIITSRFFLLLFLILLIIMSKKKYREVIMCIYKSGFGYLEQLVTNISLYLILY